MDELKNLECLNIKTDKLSINTVIITSIMVNSITNRSDEGLTLETSAFLPLRWLIYAFNSVVNTKLPAMSINTDRLLFD